MNEIFSSFVFDAFFSFPRKNFPRNFSLTRIFFEPLHSGVKKNLNQVFFLAIMQFFKIQDQKIFAALLNWGIFGQQSQIIFILFPSLFVMKLGLSRQAFAYRDLSGRKYSYTKIYVHKSFWKTNISYPLIRTRTCVYQEVRNISLSENIAYVLNGCSLTQHLFFCVFHDRNERTFNMK